MKMPQRLHGCSFIQVAGPSLRVHEGNENMYRLWQTTKGLGQTLSTCCQRQAAVHCFDIQGILHQFLRDVTWSLADKNWCVLAWRQNLFTAYPGGMVRTETYLRSKSGNGPLMDQSSPIKNLWSTGLLQDWTGPDQKSGLSSTSSTKIASWVRRP